MGIEVIAALAGAIASLLAGGLASGSLLQKVVRWILRRPEPAKPYSERLAELTSVLVHSSQEVDRVLNEVTQVARDRHAALQKLEDDLVRYEQREQEIKDRIAALENVPLPVAEHFAMLTQAGERRNAKRDYILFGAGVVVSTITTLIFQFAF